MTHPFLRLLHVSKVYPMPGEDVHALKNASLDLSGGEFVSIVGASGSGKTTLLYLLGLLTSPTSGRYEIDGRDVGGLSDRERSAVRAREIGFVFQAFHLLPQLNVLDNVILSTRYAQLNGTSSEVASKARQLLERVGLEKRLRHRPEQLSGGEMQRVAIARALLNAPRLILADEPTGNLDAANGEQIFALLNELSREGRTVVLVTHNHELAVRTHRMVRLRNGEVADVAQAVA